jgi:hypothetical protein
MAIRIREVEGHTIALCAAETKPKAGDLYLDDAIHHALSTKFGLDWKEEGHLEKSLADPVLRDLMLKERI